MVALHAHGGGAPAQGFHGGFINRPGRFSEPGLHTRSIRIPMAFTALSPYVHWDRVPIASSEVVSFYCDRKNSILGRTLVVFRGHAIAIQQIDLMIEANCTN
jgi:hypothetical protein